MRNQGIDEVQIEHASIGSCEVIRLVAYIGSLSAVTVALLNEELTGTLVRRGDDYFLELILPKRVVSDNVLARAADVLASEARAARRLAMPGAAAVAS
jgi:hypothetical protein